MKDLWITVHETDRYEICFQNSHIQYPKPEDVFSAMLHNTQPGKIGQVTASPLDGCIVY